VWLPVAHWNRKFHAIGNAGWAGQISTSAMIQPLAQGYATASTDTGHDSPGVSFALGVFHAVGRKFDRFWDVAWFERPVRLNEPDRAREG
jgi:hypothetical protein